MLNTNKLKQGVWFYGHDMKMTPFETNTTYGSHPSARKASIANEISVHPQVSQRPELFSIFQKQHFRCLRPLVIVMAVYGILPISLKPVRLGCHPLRSTMMWVVVVNMVVGWSLYNVVTSLSSVLLDSYWRGGAAPSMDLQLFAVQSMAHISSHILLVIMWIEFPFVRKRFICWDKFFGNHGSLVSGLKVSRHLVVVTWLVVLQNTLVVPGCVVFFLGVEKIRHVPAHLYQSVLVSTVTAVYSLFCYTIRDLALMLRQKLEEVSKFNPSCDECSSVGPEFEELNAGSLRAERVKAFRMAWISLRELLKSAAAMPACAMFTFGYLLTMITLSAVQFLTAMQRGINPLMCSSAAILVHRTALLNWICDSAHQARNAVNSAVEPLEMGEWTETSEELRLANQQLQNVVKAFPAYVSCAGYFKINRSAFLSMIAAVLTYVIVIIQFRNNDSESSINGNTTDTLRSYLASN